MSFQSGQIIRRMCLVIVKDNGEGDQLIPFSCMLISVCKRGPGCQAQMNLSTIRSLNENLIIRTYLL